MDIVFNCQACGQHLVIDEAGAGLVVQCPECGKDVTVPNPAGVKPDVSAENKERTVALKWTPPTRDDSRR
jgi:uncharacterized Zn finger protein